MSDSLLLTCFLVACAYHTDVITAGTFDSNLLSAPINSSGAPVDVEVSMFVLDVSKVDHNNMEFTAQFYFRQKWHDSRLRSLYAKLPAHPGKEERFFDEKTAENVWKPDLFFVNEREGRLHTVVQPNVFWRLYPNGTVFHSERVSVTLSCAMDLRMFPHDSQSCLFHIESYGFTMSELSLRWSSAHSDEHPAVSTAELKAMALPDFRLAGLQFGTQNEVFSTGAYTRLNVQMDFQRKLGFYMTKIYVPYILLVLIAGLSFWIDPKLQALRLSLLLSVLFIMLALSSDINDYIPPAAYTKAIDVWIAFCLSFSFSAFLIYLFVRQFGRKEQDKYDKPAAGGDPDNVISDKELQKGTEKDDVVSETFLSSSKFVARSLRKAEEWGTKADSMLRLAYPVLFGIFNLIYWCSYAS